MNIKMPDFNLKNLVKDAGNTFQRVVQVSILNKLWKSNIAIGSLGSDKKKE